MSKISQKLASARHHLGTIRTSYSDRVGTRSYSQQGEDMLLRNLFEGQTNGFYVDVGAHHPVRFSNTYHFYRRGWRGINIDAMPGSMRLFEKMRPRDINLEIAVSAKPETLTYYCFNDSALNGFLKDLSNSRNHNPYQITATRQIRTRTLADILAEYLPTGQKISFLSVDVEGLDFDVLSSNNWQKYSAEIVAVEIFDLPPERPDDKEIYRFLKDKNYKLIAKTANTAIFKKTNL